MKAARGAFNILKYRVLNLCSNRHIDYHKRSHSWYAVLSLFCFGLKFWPQLEINETPNFSQTNSHYRIKLEVSACNSRNTLLL